MRRILPCLLLAALPVAALPVAALPVAAPKSATPATRKPGAAVKAAPLNVRAVAVFKDGHALVRAEATGVPDRDGFLEIDRIPSPVAGSFLPFVTTTGVTLDSVILNREVVRHSRPAANLAELLRLNSGTRVRVLQTDGKQFEATIGGETLQLESVGPGSGANVLRLGPVTGVHLKTEAGQLFLPQSMIRTLTFVGPFTRRAPSSGTMSRMRMRFAGAGNRPVTAGMVYLQRGLKWIPSYRVEADGQGGAKVRLQTTLVNELAELKDSEVQFVIGVPRIFNEEAVDPVGRFASAVGLSNVFNPDAVGNMGGFGGFGGGGFGGSGGGGGMPRCGDAEPGADEEDEERLEGGHEDLFYLPTQRVSLKVGETLVRTVADFSIAYRDVYTADIPFVPTVDEERARGLTAKQRNELSAQLTEVRAKHQIRLQNSAAIPLTTGSASIFREGRLAAHSLIMYTPIGGSSLCLLSDAPEIQIRSFDDQTSRTEEVLEEGLAKLQWVRLGFKGTVRLENQSDHSVDLEVVRNVPGNIDAAPEGTIFRSDRFEETGGRTRSDRPWVNRRTGSGRITWSLKLAPGEKRVLEYAWHAYRL